MITLTRSLSLSLAVIGASRFTKFFLKRLQRDKFGWTKKCSTMLMIIQKLNVYKYSAA